MANETTPDSKATGEALKADAQTDAVVETKVETKVETAVADIALKFPDGFKADEALVGKLLPLFKKQGLDSAKAQELVDAYAGHQAELSKLSEKESAKAFEDLKVGYLNDLKADKEIGGAKFDATIGAVKKALTKYGTPELSKLFDETGFGNHPEVVRFIAKVGGALTEDSVAGAKGNGAAATDPNEHLWRMYPAMRPKTT